MVTTTWRQGMTLLFGTAVALLGAAVMVGWHLHIKPLLQIHPSFPLMQFNTALGFLLSGLACVALQQTRLRLAGGLAACVALLGGLTLWQITTGANLHIDQLFMQPYATGKESIPGRMAPNTALCFLLTGVTIGLLSSPLSAIVRNLFNSVLAPAIMALALIALSGYLLGFDAAFGWGHLTSMAVHTAAGFMVVALCLILTPVPGQRINVLPAIGIALLVLVLTLWQALRTQQVTALNATTNDRVKQIQANWQLRVADYRGVLTRIAERRARSGTGDAAWRTDAQNYIDDFGFLALVWGNDRGDLSVVGNAGVAELVLAHLSQHPCRAANLPSWKIVESPSEATDRLVVQVLARPSARPEDGCIIAVHSLRRQLNEVREQVKSERFPWTIRLNGQTIYQEASDGLRSAHGALYPEADGLTLALTPTQAQSEGNALPEWVLLVGLVLDGLLVLALYLAGVANHKKREAEALKSQVQENSTLYRGLLNSAPYGILLIDESGAVELANPALKQLFGYAQNELIGQPIETLIPLHLHGAHVKQRSSYLRDAGAAKRMASTRQVFGRHRNGENIAVEVNIVPVHIGTRRRAMAMVVDVRERVRAQQVIAEQNERFVMASTAANIGFWDYNLLTNTLQWDECMYTIYGRSPQAGVQPYDLWRSSLHPDDVARSEQDLSDAINGIRKFDTEFRIHHPNGTVRTIKAVASVQRDGQGLAVKVFGVNFDVTEARQAEQRQAELIGKLSRVNDELTSFTYIASHDLKSPLRGIDQLASWITEDLGERLQGDTLEHLRLMRSRIQRMEMLLDDLLAYSRVGRSSDMVVSVNTRELLNNIFEMQATTKPMQLVLADDMPVLNCQKVPLELVFRNLISNAIKHHDKPQGTIRVSASQTTDGYAFTVQDDGPGIPPEHQERVFTMFQTLKPRDAVEGSGIGLAIVKKAVESVGGTVTLESDGQHGCTFRFTWPTNHLKDDTRWLLKNDPTAK